MLSAGIYHTKEMDFNVQITYCINEIIDELSVMPPTQSFEITKHWFIFQQEHLLFIHHLDELQLPTDILLSNLNMRFNNQHTLGIFNDVNCICAELSPDIILPSNIKPIPLRKALDMLGNDWFVVAAKAASILKWYRNHQFCGHCGNTTSYHPTMFECSCLNCGLTFYPRISPSIIVLIKKGDHILMSRSPHFSPGVYALIAGFIEAGESIEDAVHREVKEEVGIDVKNLHYFGSQFWPFPDSLMIGFTADYAGGELVIDHREIEAAGWYRYDNLPGKPSSNISIAKKLIDHFVEEQTELHDPKHS